MRERGDVDLEREQVLRVVRVRARVRIRIRARLRLGLGVRVGQILWVADLNLLVHVALGPHETDELDMAVVVDAEKLREGRGLLCRGRGGV